MLFVPTGSGITVPLGPLLSNTDFKTPLISLASSSNNVLLFSAGAFGDISARSFSHVADGVYALGLLASDLTSAGAFRIVCQFATSVPRDFEFMAVSPNYYASLSGAGLMGVNVASINGSPTAAANLSVGALASVPFTVQSGSSNTVVNTNLSNATSANYNGRTVLFCSGALQGQGATINGYNGATFQLTLTALTGAPNAGDLAIIV